MRLKTMLAAAALSLATAVTATAPASAAMPVAPTIGNQASATTLVHGKIHWRHGHPYLKGHRGFRKRRPGYKYYGGFWFPPAAFSVIITPPAAERTYQLTERHYRWCENHYRSYRRSDNTFQPYHGPRKQCVSPYMYQVR